MQEPRKQNTKTALLRAAERLFAEKGLGGVTSKDILRAAGARNETAIQYHFGDVQTLIKEVFYDRFKEIERTRQQRLDAVGFEGDEDEFQALIAASIAPLFESCLNETGRLYARFCIQFANDPTFNIPELMQDVDARSVFSLRERLVVLLGYLPPKVLLTRLRLGFSISLIQVADFARRVEQGHAPPLEDAIGEATAALCGYLRAKPMA